VVEAVGAVGAEGAEGVEEAKGEDLESRALAVVASTQGTLWTGVIGAQTPCTTPSNTMMDSTAC
jgi:hypothetical protein